MTRRKTIICGFSVTCFIHVCLVASHSNAANDTEQSVSACFNQPNKVLVMNCSSGHMVFAKRVFYGYSPTGRCGYSSEDCIKDVPKEENYPCVGHHTCGINLPSGSVGRVIPQCNQHTNYMEALYRCIPATEVEDICRVTESTKQSGFVKTPLYPINYPTRTECKMAIRARYPGQRLRLYVIDFHLETNDSRCPDLFRAYDDLRSFSACGSRSRDLVFTTHGNSLTLEFISNHETTRKGFWLYYEAFPHMEEAHMTQQPAVVTSWEPRNVTGKVETVEAAVNVSSSNHSSSQVNVTTREAVLTGDTELTTQSHQQNKMHSIYQVDSPFPLGILVGVFLGALLVVLVVLLIVLIVRKRKASRKASCTNSASCSSQAAFLGSKNNLQQAGPINCINNHLYKEERPHTQANLGVTRKDTHTANIFAESDVVTKEGPIKVQPAQELELGLKDPKLPAKGPYISTDDTGEELLYC